MILDKVLNVANLTMIICVKYEQFLAKLVCIHSLLYSFFLLVKKVICKTNESKVIKVICNELVKQMKVK